MYVYLKRLIIYESPSDYCNSYRREISISIYLSRVKVWSLFWRTDLFKQIGIDFTILKKQRKEIRHLIRQKFCEILHANFYLFL